MDTKKLVENLITLQKNYANTPRAIITEERYKNIVESGLMEGYKPDSREIREPLIEHIGHLPIIASYLHQYIENRDKIDLGKVLAILSVHDIGETEVGDVVTYSKTDSHEDREDEAARKLLPDYQYEYFKEYKEGTTIHAKFAKAVDAIAPILHEMTVPKVTAERFAYYRFTVDDIVKKKLSYFAWDPVLAGLFEYTTSELRKVEIKK